MNSSSNWRPNCTSRIDADMTAAYRPSAEADVERMRAALALAGRGLGNVWPNPAVGCVIVQSGEIQGGQTGGGQVVGRGWTQPGGRPHAETQALARAGDAARGATAYVSLEPASPSPSACWRRRRGGLIWDSSSPGCTIGR